MGIEISGFDWDEGNAAKCESHGLSRSEIEEFFRSDIQLVYDFKHSLLEERFLAVGYGRGHRPMLVVFSRREQKGGVLIRPISARFMHSKEALALSKTDPPALR